MRLDGHSRDDSDRAYALTVNFALSMVADPRPVSCQFEPG